MSHLAPLLVVLCSLLARLAEGTDALTLGEVCPDYLKTGTTSTCTCTFTTSSSTPEIPEVKFIHKPTGVVLARGPWTATLTVQYDQTAAPSKNCGVTDNPFPDDGCSVCTGIQ